MRLSELAKKKGISRAEFNGRHDAFVYAPCNENAYKTPRLQKAYVEGYSYMVSCRDLFESLRGKPEYNGILKKHCKKQLRKIEKLGASSGA